MKPFIDSDHYLKNHSRVLMDMVEASLKFYSGSFHN
ncbi:unnamed protein product [Chironomus riparius]|uniref:Uncharacterized protein n=1 Tax=Chironomus riparius TaxID=315576 RepID=A0A9N9WPZ2_9DIPT|nr:unnamed protein product [Chironomus riparius]